MMMILQSQIGLYPVIPTDHVYKEKLVLQWGRMGDIGTVYPSNTHPKQITMAL